MEIFRDIRDTCDPLSDMLDETVIKLSSINSWIQ